MSQNLTAEDVLKALSTVEDPELGRDIVSLGLVKDLAVSNGRASFIIELSTPTSRARDQIAAAAKRAVEGLGASNVEVKMTWNVPAAKTTKPSNLIPQVKNTIAVASGKGGVGKSTVAANLAIALMRAGAKVGLMDTDLYGPSVPILMGGREEPRVVEGKLEPPREWGVKLISMAYFLPRDEAVIWRGPMLHKTVQQFLGDVRWGELDYLVMDLPPGTGDIQLSLSQSIPLTGAVIVSTPQDLALLVASKAIAMFQKLNVPILGIIENMSYYICPHCGKRDEIFGHGGARTASKKLGFRFLGEIPLNPAIRVQSDNGKPVALDDTTVYGKAFDDAAAALATEVSRLDLEESAEISIE
jgi:ATP-binding protein involved in chromosome partitioning